MTLTLKYQGGTIVISERVDLPFVKYDERLNVYRCLGVHYRDLVEWLRASDRQFVDLVKDLLPFNAPAFNGELRWYQREALGAWRAAAMKGVIALPTGAGKTLIALRAIYELQEPALILAPTIDLMQQWKRAIERVLAVKAGTLGGGEHDVMPVTVATYDSALNQIQQIGNRFNLLVADEAHHLPAQTYSQIAVFAIAEHRMGLSATPEREDGRALDPLIGPVVYRLLPSDLAGKYLSDFTLKRVVVDLEEDEMKEYRAHYDRYVEYLRKRGIIMKSPRDLLKLVALSERDQEAREALLARNAALRVALNARGKIDALIRVLEENRGKKAIIFTDSNELAYRVSRELLIPVITHLTPKDEREAILEGFRSGRYMAVVTSRVLNEGIDVPDASLGIILSGTGSRREFIQRLGRLLRRAGGKRAELVEIVSRGTKERWMSYRRREGVNNEA